MLFTISLAMVGLITVFAMIMMIGNVLTRSKYGKTWAMVATGSLLMAGLLLVVQMFAPTPEETAAAEAKQDAAKGPSGQAQADGQAQPGEQTAAAASVPQEGQAPAVDAGELAYLTTVLDNLKQGKPIPPEYLALLPDGGKGIQAMMANSGTQPGAAKLSQPLIQQIVATARSQGKTVNTASTYVPTHTASTAPKTTGTITPSQPPASGSTAATTPTPAPSKPAETTKPVETAKPTPAPTQPAPQPAPTPTPQPAPAPQPQPQPQPAPAAGTLLNGGVLKSVLGKSKADVKSFFQYNQFLGENGSTLTYLRGSTVVEVTLSGDTATSVYMRFDRFNPPGREQSYYETYMMGVAGMSQSEPSSRSGQNATWNGVYSGASSIQFHVDTNTNSGYVRASR